jgi:hypothetical protein
MALLIVAPASAAWPRRAIAAVKGHVHVAWVQDLRAVGALVARAGIRAIAIDITSVSRTWAADAQRFARLMPALRIVVVRDDGSPHQPGTVAWPLTTDDALELLALDTPTA